jgi:hypothetical protein
LAGADANETADARRSFRHVVEVLSQTANHTIAFP